MKSIFLAITFVFGTFALSAQSDKLVKVIINKAQYEYLTTNIVELQNSVEIVQTAFQEADNYRIGKTKGGIIKIVHQAPAILSNICQMLLASESNPDAVSQRQGIDYEVYAQKVNQTGDYVELQLTPAEVEALNKVVKSIRIKKANLKKSQYAIHESQKAEGSEQNLAMLSDLTVQMEEAIDILKTGKNR